MYKVGFIDDDSSLVDDYMVRLRRKDIELIFVKECVSKKDVIDWVLENKIKCMLVDYQLSGKYSFNGTELVAYLNSELPDLPCIVLTNFCDQGINENMVVKNLIIPREDLDKDFESEVFEQLINTFKQAVEVFNNRLKLRTDEFALLKQKKDAGSIDTSDEERLIELYKILRAYNEVDDMPAELLTSNASKKMNDILESLNKLIDKTK